ncbi:hypothetical protein [Rhodococcus sp. P1Y]|uniref:hypothetical protein n=1 Tax=Rhodococcus sp. P1Y TaxID=1302308 RepID=UPI000EABE340|nr:hypothetical protein [Rhodococcus sp. P1Y]AYJ47245.1 hypothetical protein D8W71_01575 [Rhodococcus sp. P1Y]
MESLLLSIHVVAGILFVGPVAVVTSLFPRYAPVAGRESAERKADIAQLLHRITRVYGLLAIVVPVVGLILAAVQGRIGEVWITTALVLTVVAGGLLALLIAPLQKDALESGSSTGEMKMIGMSSGVFNLLWVIVVVLMIVRPGSSYA